jgi:polysaccharide pyruvyl transferase WcaK-like protein
MVEDVDFSGWAELLNRFVGVGVRGPRSAERLRALGVDGVRVVGDPALALVRDELSARACPPRVALNVAAPFSTGADAARYHRVIQALVEALEPMCQNGSLVIPIALHRTDVGPTRMVLDALGVPEDVPVAADPAAFFALLEGATLSIGVRLHAAVLSCCAGVPPVLVGYRDKCLDFMESVDLVPLHVPLEAVSRAALQDAIHRVVRGGEPLPRKVLAIAKHWRGELASYAAEIRSALATEVGVG